LPGLLVVLDQCASQVFKPERVVEYVDRNICNCKLKGIPTLAMEQSGVERANRSGGLHKRSAEDWDTACGREGRSSP
jgi:hypothetical protein